MEITRLETNPDAFPTDSTEWQDTDGDGYGDNPAPAFQPDACLTVAGTSTQDRPSVA